jgi:3D (Asp-Asp-Asp) domain-containing protein/cell division protein FtsB
MSNQHDDLFDTLITISFVILTCIAVLSFFSKLRNEDGKLDTIYNKLDEIASTTDAQAAEIRELKRINNDLTEQIEELKRTNERLETRLDSTETRIKDEIKRIDEEIDILTQADKEPLEDDVIEASYMETPAAEAEEHGIVASAVAIKTENTYMEEIEDTDNPTFRQDPNPVPSGAHLTAQSGTFNFEGHTETYYNLDMSVVVQVAQSRGIAGEYHVRSDGAKMIGDYIMVAADYSIHPYGSLVNTSLGMGIVVDTGGFIAWNPYNVDVATNWN